MVEQILIGRYCKTCDVSVIYSEEDNTHLSFWAKHFGHEVINNE